MLFLANLLLAISRTPIVTADVSTCKLPATDVGLSSGFGFASGSIPSIGTVKAFMIFVDFPDAQDTGHPKALQDVFLPEAQDWFYTSSFGQMNLTVQSDTAGFIRMPATSSSYGWQRGLTYESHRRYIQDAVNAYQGGFPQVDILYIVPSSRAKAISFSPEFSNSVTTESGVKISSRAVTFGMDAYDSWRYKVLNHETGHALGLPDMYPLPTGATELYVGGWNLMGNINGISPDYFGWDKWRLGWVPNDKVNCLSGQGTTTHILSPIEVLTGANLKLVVIKISDTTALVVEVRSNLGVNKDSCSMGVLIYQIWTNRSTGKAPFQVINANPTVAGCGTSPLNAAPLTLGHGKASSYTVPGLGITVTLLEVSVEQDYTIQIRVA
ncbi:M6 metalloprotease [Myriangium duriaei CBS 260.36]|uniref:M6 metalloprotease n=1 Tax=Myriangium duriaei CBS 260.36 TaxID=1168546 RepID=A0A9P4MGH7_9PEZI|nr:M6 metalloprotease [Myriangium duriaei CBS 260.36]